MFIGATQENIKGQRVEQVLARSQRICSAEDTQSSMAEGRKLIGKFEAHMMSKTWLNAGAMSDGGEYRVHAYAVERPAHVAMGSNIFESSFDRDLRRRQAERDELDGAHYCRGCRTRGRRRAALQETQAGTERNAADFMA